MIKTMSALLGFFVGLLAISHNVAYADLNQEDTVNMEVVSFNYEIEEFEVDLDNFDFNQSISEEVSYRNDDGEWVSKGISFTPSLNARASSNAASVGAWRSWYNTGVVSMSYWFDVSRSGTQWKMSNARDHQYSGLLTSFSSPSLRITRATSTNSSPAQIDASVVARALGVSTTWKMQTTINSSGTMRLTHN